MPETHPPDPMLCPRCRVALQYDGIKLFHEGTRWGALGELGELAVNREAFAAYHCPRCGRVELFMKEIGVDLRSELERAE